MSEFDTVVCLAVVNHVIWPNLRHNFVLVQ